MRSQDETKKILKLVQVKTERKMAEIRNLLVPDVVDHLSAVELAERLADRMRTATPDEKRLISVKTALAIADLEDTSSELSQHLEAIGEELLKIRGHSQAANVYGQRGLKSINRRSH
jgi:pyruvate-formate lyase-activating enzyme